MLAHDVAHEPLCPRHRLQDRPGHGWSADALRAGRPPLPPGAPARRRPVARRRSLRAPAPLLRLKKFRAAAAGASTLEGMEEARPSLARRAVAILVLAVAAWILLK